MVAISLSFVQIILLEAQCYWITKAQLEQLPPMLLPSGCKEGDKFVQEQITFSSETGLTAIAS